MGSSMKHNETIEVLRDLVERWRESDKLGYSEYLSVRALVDELEITSETSDGHHTFSELYHYRMLYNAVACRAWLKEGHTVVKSWKHHDGELCFGGGWFIVQAELPTGQVSNHYKAEYWDLFGVPEVGLPMVYDGHTPAIAAARMLEYLLPFLGEANNRQGQL